MIRTHFKSNFFHFYQSQKLYKKKTTINLSKSFECTLMQKYKISCPLEL